ncbi:MAG TPA: DUF2142 domain-containing protein [Xanthobacteraceae bacterium]|nr:DUF2142 domain-containing protein [Xanthobacteraceae bacterium]
MKHSTCVFAALAFLFGLSFLVTTPPVRYPDETGHYLRAVSVADALIGTGHGPAVARLPASLHADLSYFAGRIAAVAHGHPFAIGEITSRLARPHPAEGAAEPDVDIPLSGAQMMVYHGIAYLPQAIGLALARAAGGSFVVTLWAARLGGLIASVLITIAALRLLPPFARTLGIMVSLLPMAVYLRGSAAPDAIVTAVALAGVAAFLRSLAREQLDAVSVAVVLAVTLFLALVKPPYLCILMLALAWLRPMQSARRLAGRAAIVLALGGLAFATAAWHASEVSAFAATVRLDIPPAEFAAADKLAMLRTAPGAAAAIFLRSLLLAPSWAHSAIARFGWADINPPMLLHALVIAWGAAVIFIERARIAANLTLALSALLLATFLVQVVLVSFSVWLFFTQTSSPVIQSIQGRHFLPLLICGVLGAAGLLCRRVKPDDTPADPVLIGRLVAGGATLLLTLSLAASVLGEYGLAG